MFFPFAAVFVSDFDLMTQLLPDTTCHVTYASFRAAFVMSLEHLLADALDVTHDRTPRRGLFERLPTLSGMSPQVQLECLFRTWNRSRYGVVDRPDVLDECVMHAAGDCLSRIAQDQNPRRLEAVFRGPCTIQLDDDHWLASRTRCLQIASQRPHSEAFFREFESLEQLTPLTLDSDNSDQLTRDDLLELVGRWPADRDTILNSVGLLTDDEQAVLRAFFEEHPSRLRS